MIFSEEQKKYVGSLSVVVLAVLVLFLLALTFNAIKSSKYIGTGGDLPNTLTFTGESEVRAEPDIAKISFSFEKESGVVADAQDVVSEKISSILTSLDNEGIKEKDIRTSAYTTNPRYDWSDGKQELKGYVVSQSIDLVIRDIEKTNDVISILGQAGVTNISGPTFEIENKEEYQRTARKEAISAAQAKAEELALDLGVKLVRIVSFNENVAPSYPQPYMYAEMAMDNSASKAAPEIPTGENVIISQVTITYEIQ